MTTPTHTHPIAADTLTVTSDNNGTWTLTVTVPGQAPIAVTGTYLQMQSALDAATVSVQPADMDRQAIATQLWDELTDHLRQHADRQRLDDEQTIDEFLDGIEAFSIGSYEWDNGYFPSGVIALGRIGDDRGVDLGIDLYLEDGGDGLEVIVSDHTEDLILLGGDQVGRHWSYRLDRPAERPAAPAQNRPAAIEGDAA